MHTIKLRVKPPSLIFSWEIDNFFKKDHSKEHQSAAAFALAILLNSDNSFKSYEQSSYYQFNRNLSSCIV